MNTYDYFIVEGKGKPGKINIEPQDSPEVQFWKLLNLECWDGEPIILPLNGVGNIKRVLSNIDLTGSVKRVIVCIDWFASEESMIHIKRCIREEALRLFSYGIQVYCIKNYTFEWSLLSIQDLLDWLFSHNRVKTDIMLKYYMELIHKLREIETPSLWYYADNRIIELLTICDIHFSQSSTFEQICTRILTKISSVTPNFIVTKSKFGYCWKCGCTNESECYFSNKPKARIEKPCGFIELNVKPTRKDKYLSISRLSKPLSSIEIVKAWEPNSI